MTIPDFGDRIAQLFAQQERKSKQAPTPTPAPTANINDAGLGNNLNISDMVQMFQKWTGTLQSPEEGDAPPTLIPKLPVEDAAEMVGWECPECHKVLAKPGRHPSTHKKAT